MDENDPVEKTRAEASTSRANAMRRSCKSRSLMGSIWVKKLAEYRGALLPLAVNPPRPSSIGWMEWPDAPPTPPTFHIVPPLNRRPVDPVEFLLTPKMLCREPGRGEFGTLECGLNRDSSDAVLVRIRWMKGSGAAFRDRTSRSYSVSRFGDLLSLNRSLALSVLRWGMKRSGVRLGVTGWDFPRPDEAGDGLGGERRSRARAAGDFTASSGKGNSGDLGLNGVGVGGEPETKLLGLDFAEAGAMLRSGYRGVWGRLILIFSRFCSTSSSDMTTADKSDPPSS